MGDVSVNEAIEKVRSERLKERNEGLVDLRHILTQSRRGDRLELLNDKAYHKVYEALFRAVAAEKSAYAKATKANVKSQAATRLAAAAALVRLAVEAGVRKLKQKTVKALTDHITQTLPIAGRGFCEPLCLDYLKALRALLDFAPHVEHLAAEEWQWLVEFCGEGISLHDGGSDAALPPAASNGTLSSVSTARSSSESKPHAKMIVEELVVAIGQLLRAQKLPTAGTAQLILTTLLHFFRHPQVGRAHQPALVAINATLRLIAADYLSLTEQTIRDLLPILRRLWGTRSTALKDEILIALIHAQTYLEHMIRQRDEIDLASDLEALLELLHTDYVKRLDREQLLLDDVGLDVARPVSGFHNPLHLPIMYLQSPSRSEQAWVILHIMAVLAVLLDIRGSPSADSDAPAKRRRMNPHVDDLLHGGLRLGPSPSLCSLQIVPFLMQARIFGVEELHTLTEQLMSAVRDDNSTISSWATLALSSCAFQRAAHHGDVVSAWPRIWELAEGNANSPSTCRASCQLMEILIRAGLVTYNCIAPLGEWMTSSADARGPASLTDTAVSFWIAWLDTIWRENPKMARAASERILQWLFERWNPSKLTDRSAASLYAHAGKPTAMLDLLSICTGRTAPFLPSSAAPGYGPLAQAWQFHCENEKLARYLLLLDPLENSPEEGPRKELSGDGDLYETSSFLEHNDAVIAEFCALEFERAQRAWLTFAAEHVSHINADMLRTLTAICILGESLVSGAQESKARATRDLLRQTEALTRALTSFLSSQRCDQSLVDAVLEVVAPFVPERAIPGERRRPAAPCLVKGIVKRLTQALDERRNVEQDALHHDGTLEMDLDDDFESQGSRFATDALRGDLVRDDVTARASVCTFRHVTSAHLHLLADGESGPPLVEYLTSLPAHELLACRSLVRDVCEEKQILDRPCADRLLVHLGQEYLQSYEYDRCELSMGLCLDAMAGLAHMWSSDATDDLAETSESLYEWFIDVALANGLASSRALMKIADLLQGLLAVAPDYVKRGSSCSSVRTSLFKVLHDGDVSVKFHLAEQIANVFALFDFHQHEATFEEVLLSLPRDADWKAGIALRLLVLARLASSWYTLLRRSVYHLVETAGLIPDATGHATRCLSDVATALHLPRVQELFHLFLPQIIYTWLETQSLHSLPFAVVGYDSLPHLLKDIQDEAAGQLVMRGNDDHLRLLAESLEISVEEVVIQSFDKIMAYSVARDISLPPVGEPRQYVGGEVRVRKRLGTERFLEQVSHHFARTLALFFRCIDQEDQIERAFAKRPQFAYAAMVMREIIDISSSRSVLPANQQPSFRARYLLDEILHLCRRTKHDVSQIWTPALLAFILRELLDSVHPALGSLHSCSVLRRIRILVCIAGVNILEAYPLEVLLHSLQPFVADPHCADDAIGLIQYLFRAGSPYLSQVPSFVAGVSLSILARLRALLEAPRNGSATGTSMQTTLEHARSFQDWFSEYLHAYDSPHLTGESEIALKTMLKTAIGGQGHGKASAGTDEGRLLRELLDDERSGRRLLNRPAHDLAFAFVCQNFEGPPSYRDDICGSDEAASAYAITTWRSCRQASVGDGYLSWAGRVLGRAFASTGQVPTAMLPESDLTPSGAVADAALAHPSGSKAAILQLLGDVLLGDGRLEVGLAEQTLQDIVSRLVEPEEMSECIEILSPSLLISFQWNGMQVPATHLTWPARRPISEAMKGQDGGPVDLWLQDVCISLAYAATDDAVVGALPPILSRVAGLAQRMFPYILHIVLLRDLERPARLRETISERLRDWLRNPGDNVLSQVQALLTALLYLRTQPVPGETSQAGRERWLDVHYGDAAQSAVRCRLFKTALLFVEIEASEAARASRRSSHVKTKEPSDLLLEIYTNLDDPDSYYGVQKRSSLSSIMARLDYEKDGFKSLTFRGAHEDSRTRRADGQHEAGLSDTVQALRNLDLNTLSLSLLRGHHSVPLGLDGMEDMYRSARKLAQWDLPVPLTCRGEEATVYRTFQSINNTADQQVLRAKLDQGVLGIMRQMMAGGETGSSMQSLLRALAVLTEANDVLSATNATQLRESWTRMHARSDWMATGRFEDVSQILSARETVFGSLVRRPALQDLTQTGPAEVCELEIRSLLESSQIGRKHGALQSSLTAATYLSTLVESCSTAGVHITAAAQNEIANVLWDQGEMTASIRILQDVNEHHDLRRQTLHVGKPELLAKLGHQISQARLEKPDEIISRYLLPAIKELKGVSSGDEAGQVFHEFASFCDRQLQDADNLEDYHRVQRLRERKASEVRDLEEMYKGAASQQKSHLQLHRNRAKQWFDLDDREYQRLHESRQAFLRQSLENYLLCLKACETFDNDALRFCALWLEQSDSSLANKAVARYLKDVPSRKFAPLINQLCSRLLDAPDDFQRLLFPLVLRICIDHPYHGMYQIFSTSKSKGKDDMSASRHGAATRMVSMLKRDGRASKNWLSIHNASVCYARVAGEKLEDKYKSGSRVPLRKTQMGHRLEQDVVACKIPPPTMKVELRADLDYGGVPIIAKFQPDFTLASGVSAPKIVTAVASDGVRYKQLVKGGNDDLRQDAIMEQVFDRVSQLLQGDRSTRQRQLAIRTYRVLPLTTNAGIIEFVPNTIPLHDYLMPAHQKHFPKDWKSPTCRKAIAEVQSKSTDVRVQTYRQVTEHFHPVMRYFFMERFDSPTEWFERRLAYSRSTAAISILGHVLGLGDRHGHNILLDEETGEVVHIDLGVAFEQGRVLPVPEVVPFRLTRDVVDGMGITKTEGVFRRCCEFTLDALRKEAYSIMTILDVLRYDPLYSWTVSPLRVKRQLAPQDDGSEVSAVSAVAEDAEAAISSRGESRKSDSKRESNEPSEADRALTIVAKKLSKTLSVTATVNELIQQATDERNLAVLYCGWAAYA
ncbi:MAG: Serine/threonine-protein kinase tel1 [Thelocarpon superellum]|nr:MAG: Serine/threonine-protein kinase tel1 [Thelocarpon superellum]